MGIREAETHGRLPAEIRRRHALDLEEAAVEVGHVVEAHLVADRRHVAVGVHQELAGLADAHAVDEVGERVARRATEEAREAALGHAQALADLGHRQRLGAALADAADHRVDLRHRLVVVGALPLHAGQQAEVPAARQPVHELAEAGDAREAPVRCRRSKCACAVSEIGSSSRSAAERDFLRWRQRATHPRIPARRLPTDTGDIP